MEVSDEYMLNWTVSYAGGNTNVYTFWEWYLVLSIWIKNTAPQLFDFMPGNHLCVKETLGKLWNIHSIMQWHGVIKRVKKTCTDSKGCLHSC